ncbi:hypothetical protein L228DRAFT_175679 [Xylona heveae TC161]|uniref:Nucleoporin Nup54 alpha-helical domain-containing protein n=1 Tax=Xylona heveae (strain CBS 132557 / TC161) TaxID=1328760 RepID=A0A165AKE4_XYLHT|nr:hypothetical protein L228DRAFT_175679 [Xylona heveae TC161]KZF20629.1 hypothetical protein L228DRAFT_175679 [Xylona heveae TC161]
MSLFGGSAFGGAGQNQQQSGGGQFGGLGQQSQQNKPLFGSSTTGTGGGGGGGLFGSSTAQNQPQQQTSGGLFGQSRPAGTSLFGGAQQQPQQQQQQQQQTGGLFGSSVGQPSATHAIWDQGKPSTSLFGSTLQPAQQQAQAPQPGLFGQTTVNTSSLWQPGSDVAPRQKTIPEQMQLIAEKWDPNSANCAFQHYFYNKVPAEQAPYYRPPPDEDEKKWEEALSKKPIPNTIPVLGKGFQLLGRRLEVQVAHVNVLQTRLHEINNTLTSMLQNLDLVISIRTMDAKRRHVSLSHRCLSLATKVQVLRNRGYAMDAVEEDLRKKLLTLERGVFDPALVGRGEEIWARMVGVRERARVLQEELDKAGRSAANGTGQGDSVDEEVVKKATKILQDYAAQLAHLDKELTQIQSDFTIWEKSTFVPNDSKKQ